MLGHVVVMKNAHNDITYAIEVKRRGFSNFEKSRKTMFFASDSLHGVQGLDGGIPEVLGHGGCYGKRCKSLELGNESGKTKFPKLWKISRNLTPDTIPMSFPHIIWPCSP